MTDGQRGGGVNTQALLFGSLILALVLVLASRGF
jgi:hypothetical protein